ncbi:MAG: protein-L-isoaspartate(D-aspartate) O-methyltransferase [Planctomycetes bacterium]|nr:protein-L-isoaspartate(D-aspartate) O-methyltransferase [Planctomycetota bacterium]
MRKRMVDEQLRARGVSDERVLAALEGVPRSAFVLPEDRARAHEDGPLAIGLGQTISQPYIVGFMSAALELTGSERVLEVGTGCGYQTAVLAWLAREVHSIELVPELHRRAVATLSALGLANVHLRQGDGHRGWPEAAPFDAILVGAAPERVPQALVEQLAPGGRLVLPVGSPERDQELLRVRLTPAGPLEERLLPVRFVPMRGRPAGLE